MRKSNFQEILVNVLTNKHRLKTSQPIVIQQKIIANNDNRIKIIWDDMSQMSDDFIHDTVKEAYKVSKKEISIWTIECLSVKKAISEGWLPWGIKYDISKREFITNALECLSEEFKGEQYLLFPFREEANIALKKLKSWYHDVQWAIEKI